VIQDGEIVVAESAAIVEYLIDKGGAGFRPEPGTQAARDYTYWMHFAEGSIMPFLVMTRVFDTIERAPVPWFVKPLVLPIAKGISSRVKQTYIGPSLTSQIDYIEAWLSKRTWFCGEQLSGADIMMSFPLEAASARVAQGNRYPSIARYVKQMRAQPAYVRALEKGGPLHLE
jgi:glutathione S-transferase